MQIIVKLLAALLAFLCLLSFEGAARYIWFIAIMVSGIIFGELIGLAWTWARRADRKMKKTYRRSTGQNRARSPARMKSDEEILRSRLSDLTGPEFERMLALYFRDQGYTVHEVGVGGNDGGVDLVIIDRRGEKTAVQAKCYADHNLVPVQMVRELVGAKRNYGCVLALLITTSDLTRPAKQEAEKLKVDYWHGAVVEQKLRNWGKWKPGLLPFNKMKDRNTYAREEVHAAKRETASAAEVCICGASMVKRRNKQGVEFLGCSTFPRCRHTRSI